VSRTWVESLGGMAVRSFRWWVGSSKANHGPGWVLGREKVARSLSVRFIVNGPRTL
jgi:hypothetical protein